MSHDQKPGKVRMIDGGVLTPQPRSNQQKSGKDAMPQSAARSTFFLYALFVLAAAVSGAVAIWLKLAQRVEF